MRAKVVDVYPYCKVKSQVFFLLLKRSSNKRYKGQWRMVGGKVEENESANKTAIRELKEETGLNPSNFWTLPTINQFYEPKLDEIFSIPVFACEINSLDEPINLDDEHSDYKWFTNDEIKTLYLWPEQERIIQLIQRYVLHDQIKPEWYLEH